MVTISYLTFYNIKHQCLQKAYFFANAMIGKQSMIALVTIPDDGLAAGVVVLEGGWSGGGMGSPILR